MASSIIARTRYCIIAVGLCVGFYYYFAPNIYTAVEIVTLTCVGLIGILSFFSHVVFHKSDARRLGIDPGQPTFQFEVGFANLAIGIMTLVVFFANWGIIPQAVILGCYSLYLFQALILHIRRYVTGEHRTATYLWFSIIASAVYVGMMVFFAVAGITSTV